MKRPRRLISFLEKLAAMLPSAVPLLLGTLIVASPARVVERARDLVFDEYQRLYPREWSADLPVRIVAIDEDSIAKIGQWPWPRDKVAELTTKLAALAPAAIGFDILFSEEDRLSLSAVLRRLPPSPERDAIESKLASGGALADDALAKAIASAPVVLSETFVDDGGSPEAPSVKANFVMLGDDPTKTARHFSRFIQPLPDLLAAATGVGSVNFAPERDLIIRRAPVVFSVGPRDASALAPSLAADMLRVAQIDPSDHAQPSPSPIVKSTGASMQHRFGEGSAIISVRIGEFEIPTEGDGQVRIRYAGHKPARFISAGQLLSGAVPRDDIEGRIVLIGVTAAGLGDIRSTPIDGAVPGVEVHAELLEHAVTGASLERPDYAQGLEAVSTLIGGLLAAWIGWRFRPALSGIAILALVALGALLSWNAFERLSLLFDPMLPAATWLATWGSTTVAVYRRSENERRFVRSAFSRYLAPAVVERLAADPASLRLGGVAREITVLFSDARDFTGRSENLSAEGVVAFLNGLLTPLTAAVLARHGAIDKYLGDGLMAYWNAPLDTPDHASLACRAALDMVACIPEVDRAMEALARAEGRPHQPVAIGIGLNTGRAFVGNMGSEQRFDYSMVGDPVNVAARLEAATKDFLVPIIVSEETRRQAMGFRFIPLGLVALKGRGAALVHALHSAASDDEPEFEAFARAHEDALSARDAGRDVRASLVRARTFPQANRYEEVYRRLETHRDIVQPVGAKIVGGS
jgi:adenylate cyclase